MIGRGPHPADNAIQPNRRAGNPASSARAARRSTGCAMPRTSRLAERSVPRPPAPRASSARCCHPSLAVSGQPSSPQSWIRGLVTHGRVGVATSPASSVHAARRSSILRVSWTRASPSAHSFIDTLSPIAEAGSPHSSNHSPSGLNAAAFDGNHQAGLLFLNTSQLWSVVLARFTLLSHAAVDPAGGLRLSKTVVQCSVRGKQVVVPFSRFS
jgi:hypothetical protein